MSKLNFFYGRSSVFEVSLQALQRRKYKVLETDPVNGIIKAKSKPGLLKPSVAVEIHIQQISEQQTTLDIHSRINKNWLTPDNYESAAEKKFIYTLYKCFEKR